MLKRPPMPANTPDGHQNKPLTHKSFRGSKLATQC
jgi:hypothetical protein